MKRLSILLSSIFLLLAGCSNEPSELQFSLDSCDVAIPSEGGVVSVTVVSDSAWELRGFTSWCEPSTKSGKGSASGEVVTFSADRADNDRSVTYRFHAGGESLELRVSQKKLVALQQKGEVSLWAMSEGGELTIEYETNTSCEVVVADDATEWLSVDTRAIGQRSAVLYAAKNTTGYSREARVEVRSTEVDAMSIYYTIHQPSTSNVIYYTTTDGKNVEPKENGFNTEITHNIIYDGRGIMEFAEPLTEIRESAFSRLLNPNLKTIILPEGLEHIGGAAFNECYSLKHVTLPESLRTIGDGVFQRCESLVELTFPDSVTTIGDGVFRRCTGLRKVTMSDSVTSLGIACFDECEALEEVRLSDNITAIGTSTFYYCTSLRRANIPKATEVIENYAFCACPSLEEVTLPEGLISIGGYAFMSCQSLTEISIPEGVTTMEDNCFGDCIRIESIVLPESLTELGMNAFFGCVSLREVVIPDSITELKSGLFLGCESLEGVVLPSKLKTIGASAFNGCVSLTSMDVPATVTHINQSAFAYCYSLRSVVVRNEHLKQIQTYAFAYCSALERVELHAIVPPQLLNPDIFEGCGAQLVVYVPAESVEAYRTSDDWSNFASIIEAI